LHPLFRAEQAFWYPEEGAHLEQYYHSSAGNEHWVKSPFYYVLSHDIDVLRRRLTGPGAVLDFEVLESFQEKGYTDYLMTSTGFHIADREKFDSGRTGIMASWMTKRKGGFTDDDLDALKRIQSIFAVACRASIQRRIMRNIGNTYLGPTAAEDVLGGDIKRGDGARIRAVVWFSDLRGSTRLSDTMDPDSYLQLLNAYYECTAQPVIDNGGEILNFIGDGVLAIFPMDGDCPKAAAANAERAARAALDLQEKAEAAGTPGNAPLRFGIGLAVGEVKFGNIGVPQRLAFSGIGKVVNTVTRVEAATRSIGVPILALPSFAEAAPDEWRHAGRIDIADFDKQVDVYTLPELQGEAPAQARVSVGPPAA